MLRESGSKGRRAGIWQRCRTLQSLKQIHTQIISQGFLSDPLLPPATHLLRRRLLHFLHPHPQRAPLRLHGAVPDRAPHQPSPRISVPPQHFLRLQSPSLATQLHSKTVKLDLESDDFVRNDMINFHAKCGDSSVAAALFDAHCEVVSYCQVRDERGVGFREKVVS